MSEGPPGQSKGEDAAVPDLVRLTKGGKANGEERDEDDERTDVKSKLAHDRIVREVSAQIGNCPLSWHGRE